MDILFDYLQQRQIEKITRAVGERDASLRSAERQFRDLQETVDRLALAWRATWRMLGGRAGCTDAELLKTIQAIDAEDGKIDGRYRQPPRQCPKCGQPNNPRRTRCLYCGGPLAGSVL